MRNNTLRYIVYMLLTVFAVGNFASCVFAPKDEIVKLVNGYQLRKKPGDEHFAICYSIERNGEEMLAPEIISDAIFDGTYELLNIAEVKGSDKMVILPASGKNYLLNAYTGLLMLDGNPFMRYAKDNDGELYFETEAGLYPIDETAGLPSPVEQYYRAGRTFIYSQGGKWGVYQKLVKSGTNIFRPPVFRYLEILPARFERIRYVCGDGAHHFVAKTDGKWQLYDGWGRVRHMCIGEFDRHRMNIYSPSAAGESSVTGAYINHIICIPVGCTGKHIPYLKTRCTYTGTDEAGIIELESHEDKYSSFFTTQDDHSTYGLPWDEVDINAEYHY